VSRSAPVRTTGSGRRPDTAPSAIGLVAAAALSIQFGAALATHLFDRVGPAGAVMLRVTIAAILMVVLARPGPRLRGVARADLAVAVASGLVLAGMNLCFYEAIDRIPLGVAVTLEFSGPLAVALAGSRRWTDGVWAALAGAGVALLATGVGDHLDPVGVIMALLAGAGWVGYILLSKQTGVRFDARTGLAIAMLSGAVVLLPVGLVAAGADLFQPSVLLIAAAVAVLSSVVPYSFELVALRRVTPRAFGVMLSLDPAIAAAAGLIVLGQHLTARELVALGLVVGANLGNALTGRPSVIATTA
jgi:inner membrane transporter RhtA